MRIGLAYNQRPQLAGSHDGGSHPSLDPTLTDVYVEWDDPETVHAVADALRAFGDVVLLEAIGDFATQLAEARPDFLFNMAEGWSGPNREAHVPAIAEFLGIPYLGSDPLTLGLTLHKGRAKEILAYRNIPTAPFVLVESARDLRVLGKVPFYPLFLKPAWEGSSKGISQDNYVETPAQAIKRARSLLKTYREPVIAEQYLAGEEFTVAIMGNGREAECLPLIRYRFDALPPSALPVMGYEAKWVWDQPGAHFDVLECPARISAQLARRIRHTALAAYHALGCRDWGRVDIRLDADGVPHVLEINPLPGIIPDPEAHSCFPAAAAAAGMSYEELIQRAAAIAWRRITGRELVPLDLVRAAV